ncbi:MAG: nickel pincer cofactor biosynthesis protein LarB [Desulfovibrionaceae bacterium]
MDALHVKELLTRVAAGDIAVDEALAALRGLPLAQLAQGVTLDMHRSLRTGVAEVVFGQGKDDAQLETAVRGLRGGPEEGALRPVLATKLSPAQGAFLAERFPDGAFWERAGLFALGKPLDLAAPWRDHGEVLVVCAGASDLPVALEALGTARFLGLDAGLISDVGVAGLHRITPHLNALGAARLLIVVAGMEGALPGVLGGMTRAPIVAVPTSVGYGASFQGLAALLGMLNACAPGLVVVNIDNGFGAAAFAAKLLGRLDSGAAPAQTPLPA